jgi:hypothetical protein
VSNMLRTIVIAAAATTAMLAGPLAVSANPATEAGGVGIQGLVKSFFTGTVAGGLSQDFQLDDANPPDVAYVVDLSPTGASTSTPCEFAVIRTWYRQLFGGEREFWFTLKNVGTIDCGTNVSIYSRPRVNVPSVTAGLNPGQSVTKHWNNANPVDDVFAVGLAPAGATSTAACQFDVTRTWYQQTPGGEREFWYTAKNTGTIACTVDFLVTHAPAVLSLMSATLPSNASQVVTWVADGAVVGLSPQGAAGVDGCVFEVTGFKERELITSGGGVQRALVFTVKNVGFITCKTKLLVSAS